MLVPVDLHDNKKYSHFKFWKKISTNLAIFHDTLTSWKKITSATLTIFYDNLTNQALCLTYNGPCTVFDYNNVIPEKQNRFILTFMDLNM